MNADPKRMPNVMATIRTLIRAEFPGGVPVVRFSDRLEPQYRPWHLGATLFSVSGLLALVVALAGIGAALGVVMALAAGRLIASLLYDGVKPSDPATTLRSD